MGIREDREKVNRLSGAELSAILKAIAQGTDLKGGEIDYFIQHPEALKKQFASISDEKLEAMMGKLTPGQRQAVKEELFKLKK